MFLVFGDLHGRVLPAFKLAQAWSREHGIELAGLLQVGDFGYFPDPSRFDKATKRHAGTAAPATSLTSTPPGCAPSRATTGNIGKTA
jgi:hypothetical protein